nr:unnamed protein product [Callosobruchus analis]
MNKRQKTSYLWGYFTITDQNSKICKCDLCDQKLCYRSTVSNLKKHLNRRHPTINTQSETSASTIQAGSASEPEPTASKQQIVTSYYSTNKETKISETQKKKLDKLLLQLFTIDYQPFSIVEDLGFRSFVNALNPSYNLPNRKIISNNMIAAEYERCMTSVRTQLASVSCACITTDCWTSKNLDSYIGVTCHLIDKEFVLKSVLLECVSMPIAHTSRNLAEDPVVPDNATNIKNAIINELKLRHFGCFAHTLNLIIQDGLKSIDSLLEKVKNMVSFFKRSTQGKERLLTAQRNAGNVIQKKLIQSVPTRWNSTYFMLDRICELQDAVKTSIALINRNIPVLTEQEWIMCQELCSVLKPFETVTKRISGEKYVTGSEVIILTNGLRSVCEKLKKKKVVEALNQRLKNIEFSKTIVLATLLDPRYKLLAFSDSVAGETIKKYAIELMTNIIVSSEGLDEKALETQDEVLSVWGEFDKIISNKKPTGTPLSEALIEINRFLNASHLYKDKNPLLWWQQNQHLYPTLAKLVQDKFCILATSVPCERLFSKAGTIINERRTRLSAKHVQKILFLNVNGNL